MHRIDSRASTNCILNIHCRITNDYTNIILLLHFTVFLLFSDVVQELRIQILFAQNDYISRVLGVVSKLNDLC